ncbi:SEN15 (YMR059W) [Zygosaccharomyces parabailii]|nr:SEN15 (YMR059W) [Zygosaccharomyces parabailii]CDH12214.1 related to tRNA-splicing endonuclease subunit SEN15 [Zygosaccharomyces bailii ISA1307]SJM83841.1 related to tRNA-splicing endonuclease subunit SEN15 [Zygosaccharomyces bailii]
MKKMSISVLGKPPTNLETTFDLVWHNLAYCQLWDEIRARDETVPWQDHTLRLLEGRPHHKLSNDVKNGNPDGLEYVLPIEMSQYKAGIVTFQCLDQAFEKLCPPNVKRLTLAMANSDGTVMFYFVYKGIHKPKRN